MRTPVDIREILPDEIDLYDRVPSSLMVRSRYRVEWIHGNPGSYGLSEEPLAVPYRKDYDDAGARPSDWPGRFDLSGWGLLLAFRGPATIGGAAVSLDPALLPPIADRPPGTAVLWDLRVAAREQRRGVATSLFLRAADWARSRGCGRLAAETQDTNVPACKFYRERGCRLGAVQESAYAARPDLAHETMLLWVLDL